MAILKDFLAFLLTFSLLATDAHAEDSTQHDDFYIKALEPDSGSASAGFDVALILSRPSDDYVDPVPCSVGPVAIDGKMDRGDYSVIHVPIPGFNISLGLKSPSVPVTCDLPQAREQPAPMLFTYKIELGEPQPPRGSVAGNEKVILPVGTFDGFKLPETAKAFWGSETLEATKTSSGDAYMVTTTPTTTAGPVRVILDFEVMESTTATFEYVKRLRRS